MSTCFSATPTNQELIHRSTVALVGQTAPGKLVALSYLLYRYVEETDAGRSGLIGEIRQAVDWFRVLV